MVESGGALPVVATVLVGLNAFYICLVAVGNITDYDSNWAFVRHVLAMDTTNFGLPSGTGLDAHVMWRAVDADWLQRCVYLTLIVWEAATGLVLAAAVISWIRGRRDGYQRARSLSTIGLLAIVVLFAGGFISVGGEWFAMYRSTIWNGLEPAFRNSMLALATIVIIHLPSRDSTSNPKRQSG